MAPLSRNIARRLDRLGRLVVPPGLRDAVRRGLQPAVTPLVADGPEPDQVEPLRCVFCGTARHVIPLHHKGICVDCVREVIELVSSPPGEATPRQ